MKDTKNTLINLLSFGLSSIFGLYLYFVLIRDGSEKILGEFNIQYIFIILLSQLSTFGYHYSILRESSKQGSTMKEGFNNLFSGLTLIFLNSFVIGILIFVLQKRIISFLDFDPINIILPMMLYSLNKGFYWYLNGREKFVKMSILNPLRFILLLITYSILKSSGLEEDSLYLCFLYSEIAVLFVTFFLTIGEVKINFKFANYSKMLKVHLNYGKKSFLVSFLSDLNFKIDIIVIGILLGNESVGFYTFTSAIGEGFVGLIGVIRSISTPQFERIISNKHNFLKFKKRIIKISYSLFIPIGIFILSFSKFFGDKFEFLGEIRNLSFLSLIIVISGFAIMSYFFAYEHILLQLNYPSKHTKALLILFVTNLILNIVFINIYGINGAAAATILSYLIYFILIDRQLFKITDESFLL